MADLAPSGSAQEAGLADREGREVVVQHEPAARLALDEVEPLGVLRGAQRHRDQRLGLAAREQGRAVGPRQHADLAGEVADLVEPTAVHARAVVQHLFVKDLVLQVVPEPSGKCPGVFFLLAEPFQHLGFQIGGGAIARELVLDAHGAGELVLPARDLLAHAGNLLADRHLAFGLADLLDELQLPGDETLDLIVTAEDTLEHFVLADLVGARLDHHDGFPGAGHDEVQSRGLELAEGRVEQVLAVGRQTDTDGGDRLGERDVGDDQRRGGAGDRQHIGIVLLVRRPELPDDLRFKRPAVGEQRSQRPIDHPRGQHLLLVGTALAAEEAAGDLAGGVRVLSIVHRQRQEIDADPRRLGRDGGHQDHRVAVAHHDGSVGLFGQMAGFETQRLTADLDFFSGYLGHFLGPPGVRGTHLSPAR